MYKEGYKGEVEVLDVVIHLLLIVIIAVICGFLTMRVKAAVWNKKDYQTVVELKEEKVFTVHQAKEVATLKQKVDNLAQIIGEFLQLESNLQMDDIHREALKIKWKHKAKTEIEKKKAV